MRLTIALIAVSLLSLTGCTLSQQKEMVTEDPSLAILEEQENQIKENALRLELLAMTQSEMLEHMDNIEAEFATLNHTLKKQARNAEKPTEVKGNGAATVASEKIIRQTKEKQDVGGKAVLGRVEYVWLEQGKQYLKARVDTGANSSSLHAKNIQKFERDGEKWVRFVVVLDDRELNMEAPLERYVRIRQASLEEGDTDRRPVVKLPIQLGELKEDAEFTLNDRGGMFYPILLGRSFLRDIALVDVAKKFTRKRDPKLQSLSEANQ